MKVIAEIGSNFTDLTSCLKSVELAKDVGAWGVKFQCFTWDDLYGSGHQQTGPAGIPVGWVPFINDVCKRVGIKFGVSVFNPERVVEIVPHVDFLKIASAECLWTELIDACAKTGTPLFISSGGCTIDQIGELAALCKKGIDDGRFISKITLFFCEAAYPASHLTWERGKAVAGIAKQFGLGFGVSDHSMDVMPFMNAPYFEKHMNLVGATDTDDAAHSLNLEQAKSFCKAAKDGLAAALQFPAPTEITFREKHARRQIGEGTYRPIP